MITVTLTPSEAAFGAEIGVQRRRYAMEKGVRGKYGAPEEGNDLWLNDVVAAQAEMAVAKYLNLWWDVTIGRFDLADVGGYFEVRCIKDPSHRMVLHEADKDESPYILVLAESPKFHILGWCYGREGKRRENWRAYDNGRRTGFYVKQCQLTRPIWELRHVAAHWLAFVADEKAPANATNGEVA